MLGIFWDTVGCFGIIEGLNGLKEIPTTSRGIFRDSSVVLEGFKSFWVVFFGDYWRSFQIFQGSMGSSQDSLGSFRGFLQRSWNEWMISRYQDQDQDQEEEEEEEDDEREVEEKEDK